MSDTPEMDAELNLYLRHGEAHQVSVPWIEFARKLERERDEAREKMADALQEVDLRTLDFERMKQERDIAEDERIDMAQQLKSEKECHARCQNERDEAHDYSKDIWKILRHSQDEVLRLTFENRELSQSIIGWENKWKCAIDMAAKSEIERDEAINKLKELKDILR